MGGRTRQTTTEPSASGRITGLVAGALAVAAGLVIAWVDTRPNWDDTGVTAALLAAAALGVAFAGVRWWIAALLVATPIAVAEYGTAGPGILVASMFAVLGALIGTAVRRGIRGATKANG
jgi:uncharacterized membrane protein